MIFESVLSTDNKYLNNIKTNTDYKRQSQPPGLKFNSKY